MLYTFQRLYQTEGQNGNSILLGVYIQINQNSDEVENRDQVKIKNKRMRELKSTNNLTTNTMQKVQNSENFPIMKNQINPHIFDEAYLSYAYS